MTEQPTNEQRITLAARKCRVMAEINTLKNDGKNQHYGFKYASAAEVLQQIRVLLAKHMIAFSMSVDDLDTTDPDRWMMKLRFLFTDAITGENEYSIWMQDVFPFIKTNVKDDKAIGKAYTYAEKYFLMRTFIVGSSDDPDIDADGDRGESTNRQRNTRKDNQKQAPPQDEKPWHEDEQKVAALASKLLEEDASLTISFAEALLNKSHKEYPTGKEFYTAALDAFKKDDTDEEEGGSGNDPLSKSMKTGGTGNRAA